MTRGLAPTLVVSLGLFAEIASAQANGVRLSGVVVDRVGRPLEYTNVQINAAHRIVTDSSGAFSVSVPERRHFVVDFRRIGFSPQHLDFATAPDSAIRVVLDPIATRLDTMRTTAAEPPSTHLVLSGFYDRLRQSQRGTLFGKFVTPEEIELRQPQRATHLIEALPGVRVQRLGGSDNFMVFGLDGCVANVYFNGSRLNKLSSRGRSDEATSAYFDDIADPSALAGIEVYSRGTQAPPQYQGLNGSCAVVLIWTK